MKTDRVGPYRLEEMLGRGGQGTVYRAYDESLGRRVALKVLNGLGPLADHVLERFRREAELAARVDHPALCPVYEAGDEDGIPFIAMRYVEGETLDARSRTGFDTAAEHRTLLDATDDEPVTGVTRSAPTRRDDVRLVVAIAEQIARGLHTAHQAGILHRDVKPSNIMVTESGAPVLLDFGLARDIGGELATLTRTGDVFGTPAYMAPESLRGLRYGLDGRVDVWSLGVTVYECVTGSLPFSGATHEELFHAIVKKDPVDARRLNPRVPEDLAAVLSVALEKDIGRRYASAEDFADDLARVLDGRPVAARPAGPLERLRRWYVRYPAFAGAVTAAFLFLVGGLVTTLLQKGRADDAATRAESALMEYERLADARRLDELVRGADMDLWPAISRNVRPMKAWLVRAEALAAGLPDHRRALGELREEALDVDTRSLRDAHARLWPQRVKTIERLEGRRAHYVRVLAALEQSDSRRAERAKEDCQEELELVDEEISAEWAFLAERGAFAFEDVRLAFRHEALADLVARLERFTGNASDEVTIAGMRRRLEHAETVHERTIVSRAADWKRAAEEVKATAVYGDLELVPIEGLVPLGKDANSGLQEFADVYSGAIPKRGEDGRLQIGADTGLVFVLVPGGTFLMGSQAEDPNAPHYNPDAAQDEGPVHEVELEPYLLSKFEMSQGQYTRVAGSNPSRFCPGFYATNTHFDLTFPVDSATWYQSRDVARRLGCVLPSEAQWERACRAGTDTLFATGDDPGSLKGHLNLADEGSAHFYLEGWKYEPGFTDGFGSTAPVGTYSANRFGFHDMHGNVEEWCRNRYEVYVGRTLQGKYLPATEHRVLRGGTFDGMSATQGCSRRVAHPPHYNNPVIGVRPARGLHP